MKKHASVLLAALMMIGLLTALASPKPKAGAIRVLFLGHESEHHNSNKFYPMLAKGLGRDAIYFDYVTSVEEALGAMGETTWDRGFDKVIMTVGVGDGDLLGQAFHLGGKRSKIVVTNIHRTTEESIAVPAAFLTFFEKQLIGSLFGSANPRKDIPRLLELYTQGQLDLDGLITRTYTLDEINQGYTDMNEGKNIRGVLIYD